YPHELSGGEQQRVSLARALAPKPSLMLLDEPFASLDPNLRMQLRTEVVEVLRATDTPAVFVTHDQAEALAIGDRIAVMRAGRFEQLASPVSVFHRPVNQFVAAFMGEAAFLKLDASGSHCALGPVDGGGAEADPTGRAMVRPDDIVFQPGPDGEDRIVTAEFRGANWLYTVRLGGGETVPALGSHLQPLKPGTTGRVEMVPGHRLIVVPASE
ncbi:MAG: ABC transporter ATP-binding protein, partial [Acidimicrobiia bacterium]|nr:ABC transporter ATP-binding protein [Acidimicrobiia bacterium]